MNVQVCLNHPKLKNKIVQHCLSLFFFDLNKQRVFKENHKFFQSMGTLEPQDTSLEDAVYFSVQRPWRREIKYKKLDNPLTCIDSAVM